MKHLVLVSHKLKKGRNSLGMFGDKTDRDAVGSKAVSRRRFCLSRQA
ncbi:MAG: hypothetical protein ACLT64_10115 [Streptococcus salivarius]